MTVGTPLRYLATMITAPVNDRPSECRECPFPAADKPQCGTTWRIAVISIHGLCGEPTDLEKWTCSSAQDTHQGTSVTTGRACLMRRLAWRPGEAKLRRKGPEESFSLDVMQGRSLLEEQMEPKRKCCSAILKLDIAVRANKKPLRRCGRANLVMHLCGYLPHAWHRFRSIFE